MRLETQSEKADGGMKEVFDITVFDSEHNESKSLFDMSGGQTVWINDAVTRAICLYNMQSSQRVFGTHYSDESDGALDGERKEEFFAIKKKMMEVGGHSREFFISQTPEMVDMADARIVLEPGAVSIQ